MSNYYDKDMYINTVLSRVPCVTCKEDTIHKRGRCIHCGTQPRLPERNDVVHTELRGVAKRRFDL